MNIPGNFRNSSTEAMSQEQLPETSSSSSYFLPANNDEAERLMSQHLVLVDALGGKIVLPALDLTRPGVKILDSGTADGKYLFIFFGRSPKERRRNDKDEGGVFDHKGMKSQATGSASSAKVYQIQRYTPTLAPTSIHPNSRHTFHQIRPSKSKT